ncbi:MAG TPA: hypothetical protein VNA25_14680, partial [Phycisphaerae bacterium]|nr:hypothetical protein [Phycisphaerae bacterium]
IIINNNGTADWNTAAAHPSNGCHAGFYATLAACDPTGSYSVGLCTDTGCSDGNSCESSTGATCVVSLT